MQWHCSRYAEYGYLVNFWSTTEFRIRPWLEASGSEPIFDLRVIEIRFSGNRNGSWTGDMAVDNFSIDELRLFPVTNLSASISTRARYIELEFFDPAATSWKLSTVLLDSLKAQVPW